MSGPPLLLQGAAHVSVGLVCLKLFLLACKSLPGFDKNHICAEVGCRGALHAPLQERGRLKTAVVFVALQLP